MLAVIALVLIIFLMGTGLVINLYLYTHHAMSSTPTAPRVSVDDLFARWDDTEANIW